MIDSKENLIRLMERYQNLVFTLCLKLTGDYFTAEDIAQETFLSAYQHWHEFDGSNEKAWLCRIAANKCLDYQRSAGRRSVPTEPEQMPDAVDSGDDPQRIYLAAEVTQQLYAACASLPELYRETAESYFLEGKTAIQIAENRGINVKTVQTRILRAREMLKKMIRREDLTP